MKLGLVAALCLLCVGLLALTTGAQAQANGKIRLMVVTGGHDFDREAFFSIFQADQGLQYDEFQQPKANEAYVSGKAADYDAILLYDMAQDITEEQQAALVKLLKEQGKGLVVLHHALGSYPKWDEYERIAGGRFCFGQWTLNGKEMPPSTYAHGIRFTVQIINKKHPITKGLTDFEVVDEVYGGFYVAPDVTRLLKVEHPQSGETVGWAHKYGKARVAAIQLGHDATAYNNDSFRKLLARAIRWVARRPVGE